MEMLFQHYQWVIEIFLIITLTWYANFALGISPIDFLKATVREFRELANRPWTVGAVNALSVIAVFVLGTLIVLDQVTGILQPAMTQVAGPMKAQEYAQSVSPFTVLLVLAGLSVTSTFLVLLNDRL
jgi:hypothetical protein